MTKRIGAYLTICQEDAHWVPQYLMEAERLQLPFAVHLDRCKLDVFSLSGAYLIHLVNHRLCVGVTRQDNPTIEYTEQHKQAPFDLLVKAGFDWALNWDADETWERDAPTKLEAIAKETFDYGRQTWVNLWGDKDHIRVDTIFAEPRRVKLYNLQEGRRWRFDHPITNGCKMVNKCNEVLPAVQGETDLVCIHHGLMTRELREQHKQRWDRIYSTAVGNNPYGFWQYCLDEMTYPPTLAPNIYKL